MSDGPFRLINGSVVDQKQHVVPEMVAQWRPAALPKSKAVHPARTPAEAKTAAGCACSG
jgi:hypothetical protein